MFEALKRITIFVGHYGSGKTELAINYALRLKQFKEKVALIDLDIVNPYFRSREVKAKLEARGIKVISSAGKFAQADLPALSPEILGALQNQDYYVVIDVGGDDVGAIALGRFKANLPEEVYSMLFVVNSFRPLSKKCDSIRTIIAQVEKTSRLKVKGLVSNGNLSYETDLKVVLEGYKVTKEVALAESLPINFIGVREELATAFNDFEVPSLSLEPFMVTSF